MYGEDSRSANAEAKDRSANSDGNKINNNHNTPQNVRWVNSFNIIDSCEGRAWFRIKAITMVNTLSNNQRMAIKNKIFVVSITRTYQI